MNRNESTGNAFTSNATALHRFRFESAISTPFKILMGLSSGVIASNDDGSRGRMASASRTILLEIDSTLRECDKREGTDEVDLDESLCSSVQDAICHLLTIHAPHLNDNSTMMDMVLPSLLSTLQSIITAHYRRPILASLGWICALCDNHHAALSQVMEALRIVLTRGLPSSDVLTIVDVVIGLPSGTESLRLLLSILPVLSEDHLPIVLSHLLPSLPDSQHAIEPIAYLRASFLSDERFHTDRQTFKSTIRILFSSFDDVLLSHTVAPAYVSLVPTEQPTNSSIADFGAMLWLLSSSTSQSTTGQDMLEKTFEASGHQLLPDLGNCLSFYLEDHVWRTRLLSAISHLILRVAAAEVHGIRLSLTLGASIRVIATEILQPMEGPQQAELVASLLRLRRENHYRTSPPAKQSNKSHSLTLNEEEPATIIDEVMKVIATNSSPSVTELLAEQMVATLWDDAFQAKRDLLSSTCTILVCLMESSRITAPSLTNVVQNLLSAVRSDEETNVPELHRARWRGVTLAHQMVKSNVLSDADCLALRKLLLRALLPPHWKGVDPSVGMVAFAALSLLAHRNQGQLVTTPFNFADIQTILSKTYLLQHANNKDDKKVVFCYDNISSVFLSGETKLKKQKTLVLRINTYVGIIKSVSWSCAVDWVFTLLDHYLLAVRKRTTTEAKAWDPTSLLLARIELPYVAGLITLKGSGRGVTAMQNLLKTLGESEIAIHALDPPITHQSAIRVMMRQRMRELQTILDVLGSFTLSTLVSLSALQAVLKHAAIEYHGNNGNTSLLRLLQFQLAKFCHMRKRLWIVNFFVAATSSAIKRGMARSIRKTGKAQSHSWNILTNLQRMKEQVNSLSSEKCWRNPESIFLSLFANKDSILLKNAFTSTLSTNSGRFGALRDLLILRQLILDHLIDSVPVGALAAVADRDLSALLELTLTIVTNLPDYIDAVGRGQITDAPPTASVVHLALLSLEFISHVLNSRFVHGVNETGLSAILTSSSSQADERRPNPVVAIYGLLSDCLTFGQDEMYPTASQIVSCMAVLSQNSPQLQEQTIAVCWKVLQTTFCDEVDDQTKSWWVPVTVSAYLQRVRNGIKEHDTRNRTTAIGSLANFVSKISPKHYVEQETSGSVVLVLSTLCFSKGGEHRDRLLLALIAETKEYFSPSSDECLSSPRSAIFASLDKQSCGFFYETSALLVGLQIEQSKCEEGIAYFDRVLSVYRSNFSKMEPRVAITVLDVTRAVLSAAEAFLSSVERQSVDGEAINRLPNVMNYICEPIDALCNFANENIGNASVDRFRHTHGRALDGVLKQMSRALARAEELAKRFNLPGPVFRVPSDKRLLDWSSEEGKGQKPKEKGSGEKSSEQKSGRKAMRVVDDDGHPLSWDGASENENMSDEGESDETSISSTDESFVAAGDWGEK